MNKKCKCDCDDSPSVISMDKEYRTRAGHSVRILTTDRQGDRHSVVALIELPSCGSDKAEAVFTYDQYGRRSFDTKDFNYYDLIEVKPRIQGWLNIYDHGVEFLSLPYILHPSKSAADASHPDLKNRVACVKIDVEKGEGL